MSRQLLRCRALKDRARCISRSLYRSVQHQDIRTRSAPHGICSNCALVEQVASPPPPPRLPRDFDSFHLETDCRRGVPLGVAEILVATEIPVDSLDVVPALRSCWDAVWQKYPSTSHPFLFADGMKLGIRGPSKGACYACFNRHDGQFTYRLYYEQEAHVRVLAAEKGTQERTLSLVAQ